ncbi:MAG: hypothetical protein U1F36_16890 [Planctomycetota bacterium]
MVMGRPNKGADHVDSLDASPRERERLRALLLTIMGEISNEDAAAMLDLGLSQFASMRTRARCRVRPTRPRPDSPDDRANTIPGPTRACVRCKPRMPSCAGS